MFRKIENFVRTKYESKRWVLSKEIPDPATLGDEEGDDELVGSLEYSSRCDDSY